MTDKVVYNNKLINDLIEAREQAGVTYEVMAYIMGLPYNTVYAYITKRRNMVRSDHERIAKAAIRILTRLVKEGNLPEPLKPGRPRKGAAEKYYLEVIGLVDDCAKRIVKEDEAAKKATS